MSRKPLLVTETEPEVIAPTEPAEPLPETTPAEPIPPSPSTSQIFGPVPAEPEAPNKQLFWILIVVFTLLGALAGGVGIYLQDRRPDSAPLPAALTPLASPTVSVSPTPEVELSRADLTIQILNGSGLTGAAAKAKDYLEELGYGVDTVGNASSTNFSTTQIAIKDSKKAYLSLLTKDLGEKYTLADKTETLDEDGQYDVVITLGKE